MRATSHAGLFFFALLSLALWVSPARADQEGEQKGEHHDRGEGGHHHHAPEPLTLAGLAVGAGALAWARRRSLRNRS